MISLLDRERDRDAPEAEGGAEGSASVAEPREVDPALQVLGQRLAERRRQLRYTQGDIADLIDRTQTFVSHVEKGDRRVRADTLQRWADMLDLRYEDLAPLAGYMREERGDVLIRVPGERAPVLRDLAKLPTEVLASLRRQASEAQSMARVWLSEETRESGAKRRTREPRSGESQPHAPEAQPQSSS